ncbi:MAG TPA: (2Fe-2S)-binding protein [Deltaproteobacteria bacterium]|jgi:carbon-monoxide dehydrogenase small subunit|nr:(2Fe-2S)-binding protein [Deltaproteobacteria bacterium]MDI9542861.1 (2Fe-2S)-binding protein [Pseudomonadota bacterium]HNU75385.1 (2Fe-2S)-binding protein [Deltaproteobacteria bacterium]HOD70019.1 (2Fe-2S)-binding protein [Deltaproteobacteria bacterium]HON62642.1 (2Fe-2S)-binding protein [Deltaproteobacteria bacterium]
MKKELINLTINGAPYELEVEPNLILNTLLRDRLGLTGTKISCGEGECGACTVLVDGKPMLSCSMLAVAANGKNITTIEGLAKDGELHIIQKKFIEKGAIQCGYCSPGMILAVKALLDENPNPTSADVKKAIGGNLCRCTGYVKIVDAALAAAKA